MTDIQENIDFIESKYGVVLADDESEKLIQLLCQNDISLRTTLFNYLINYDHPELWFRVVPLISSKEIGVRNFIGELLAVKGNATVEAILDYLDECNNTDDIKFLIDILSIIGDERAADKLRFILETAENENLVLSCIEALGNLKDIRSLPRLGELFSESPVYSPAVAEAFGKIGSPEVLDFIMSNYNQEDELLRFLMIESMGLIGDENTFYFLLSELNYTGDVLVWPILKAVYNLKNRYGFDIPFDERTKNIILGAINTADPEEKIIAANILLDYDEREIFEALFSIVGCDEETDSRILQKFFENPYPALETAPEYLKTVPDNLIKVLSILIEVLKNTAKNMQELLDSIRFRDFLSILSELIKDSDEEVRYLALEVMFFLDKKTVLFFLEDAADDLIVWNRMHTAELCAAFLNGEAVSVLEKLANDQEEMVRNRALFYLSECKQGEV
jgi:HEAT repeat protein